MEIPNSGEPESTGVVVRTTGSWHDVLAGGRVWGARVRGRLRLTADEATNPVAVGDTVVFVQSGDGTLVITDVQPRRNKLSRRAAGHRSPVEHVIAANIDAIWVIQAVSRPRLNNGFVDRVLVMAGADEIEVGLIMNKMDLVADDHNSEEIDDWIGIYEDVGYPVLRVSALQGVGVEEVRSELVGKNTAMVGPSGVGKSTLLNAIQPGLGLRTGEISAKTNKGKHTTAVAARFELEGGGSVVDTPGIREFGLFGIDPQDLWHYFPEMAEIAPHCHYYNCTHQHEPECAVMAAVADGAIDRRRYRSYLNILYDL